MRYLAKSAFLDPEGLALETKATEEELQSVLEMTVVLIDGYHRIKAIWIIKNDPESLLDPELGIDWQAVQERFPNWVTVEKNGKVGTAFTQNTNDRPSMAKCIT